MIKSHSKSNPPSRYGIGEKVYDRLQRKEGIKAAQKRQHVVEAVIKKRHLKKHSYKLTFVFPLTGRKETKWLMVDDITSLTLGEEKRKQMAARLTKQRKATSQQISGLNGKGGLRKRN